MKTIIRTATICLLTTAATLHGRAQEWRKDFPESEAAYTKLGCEVVIKSDNGVLSASSSYKEDMQVATENAAKMMSRGRIYHSSFNELKKWDAYTALPESKKMKVANTSTSSSRQDYIFYDDSKATSFDFAGITAGATRHLEYELQHNDVHLLMPYYFDRYFPVIDGELKIVFPASVKLKYVVKGLNADKIRFSETRRKDKVTYTFTAARLPGEQHYADAPDNSYYATHVIFYVAQAETKGEWKNVLSSVEDLYRYNYQYIKSINQTLSPELLSLTDSITQGIKGKTEKAKKIYRWVQEHIKYVAFEEGLGGFVPRDASLVCNRRFGDCKDMSSILTAMLNHAGVPAYFTWIGTRHLPYRYAETPLPIVDNHMICTVNLDGRFIFLDGTDNSCVFGMPSDAIQGKDALVAISEKEFKVIPVGIVPKEKNLYADSTLLTLQDGQLKGHIRIYMTGYYSSAVTAILNYKNEKEREDYFKARFSRGSNKVKFSNWKVRQSEDRNEAWVTADIELTDYAKKLSDEWLLNLNLFKWYEHQEIDFPKRKTPIQNDFLKTATYTTIVNLPPGYKVSYEPKSQTYKNSVWGFELNYATGNNAIQLTQKFDTDQIILHPDQFEQWNKVLENLFPHYKQSVVLSKK